MSKRLSRCLLSARQCELRPVRVYTSCLGVPRNNDTRPLLHRQPFSTSPPCRVAGAKKAVKLSGSNAQSTPSMAVQLQRERAKAIRDGQIPDDMGLIPDTFVMPISRNRPSWFSNPRGRLKLERKRFRARVGDTASAIAYKWYTRPRPKFHIRTIAPIAKNLHKQMYTHFADGNLQPIESTLCAGFAASLRERMAQRPENVYLRWQLHKYLSQPKLVSFRAAVLPRQKGATSADSNGVRQAVVRIHSLQSLQHIKRVAVRETGRTTTKEVLVDAAGREVEGDWEELAKKGAKESVEYVVVQKSLRKSKEGPWMVWGTTEEMTLERIEGKERLEKRREKKGAGAAALSGAG